MSLATAIVYIAAAVVVYKILKLLDLKDLFKGTLDQDEKRVFTFNIFTGLKIIRSKCKEPEKVSKKRKDSSEHPDRDHSEGS